MGDKRIIGLTGGIGCGKSTVAAEFRKLGFFVIDADRLSQTLMRPGSQLERRVAEHFGTAALDLGTGHVHRRRLGKIVFGDPEARRWVMDAIAPHLDDAFECVLAHIPTSVGEGNYIYQDHILYDAPLFFEVGLHKRYPESIVVHVSPVQQRLRISKRDPDLTEADIEARIAVQMPLRDKIAKATWSIDNSGTREETAARVLSVAREIVAR